MWAYWIIITITMIIINFIDMYLYAKLKMLIQLWNVRRQATHHACCASISFSMLLLWMSHELIGYRIVFYMHISVPMLLVANRSQQDQPPRTAYFLCLFLSVFNRWLLLLLLYIILFFSVLIENFFFLWYYPYIK